MKFSATACVASLSAGVVSAGSSWFSSQDVIETNDAAKVPGDNPLEFCDTDHSKDIVHIEKVDLLPNPPEAYVFSLPLPRPLLSAFWIRCFSCARELCDGISLVVRGGDEAMMDQKRWAIRI